MARKKLVLTKKEISQIESLAQYLSLDKIGAYFGVELPTFRELLKQQPNALILYNKGRAKAYLTAGKVIMDFIKDKGKKTSAENKNSELIHTDPKLKLDAIKFLLKGDNEWSDSSISNELQTAMKISTGLPVIIRHAPINYESEFEERWGKTDKKENSKPDEK